MDYSSIKYMSSLVCNYPGVVSKRYGEVCWVERQVVAPSRGKAELGSVGQGIVEGSGVGNSVGWGVLLNYILEVTEYGIEDSVSWQCVIIIEVVIFSCLPMYVEALYGIKVDALFLEL